jgi:phosphonate transport system ATP-binding protein
MTELNLINVCKTYKHQMVALQEINLSVPSGQFLIILGSSGAGKSTLMRILNGLELPSRGRVIIDGIELKPQNLKAIRTRIGVVFQQFNLVDRLNVMTNVLVGRLGRRHWLLSSLFLFPKSDMRLAHWALARVGLVDKAWARADQLSGGQQQRVGIARALAQEPNLILADEPVASLDPVTSVEIMSLLKEICREQGITIVANLHQLEYARDYADRIIGLNQGRIVFDGSPADLTSQAEAAIYQRHTFAKESSHDLVLADS